MERIESSFFTGPAANQPASGMDDKTATLARCLRLLIDLHRLQQEIAGQGGVDDPERRLHG